MIWYDIHDKVMMKTNYIWSKTYYVEEKERRKKSRKNLGREGKKEKKYNKEKQYTAVWIVIMICIW